MAYTVTAGTATASPGLVHMTVALLPVNMTLHNQFNHKQDDTQVGDFFLAVVAENKAKIAFRSRNYTEAYTLCDSARGAYASLHSQLNKKVYDSTNYAEANDQLFKAITEHEAARISHRQADAFVSAHRYEEALECIRVSKKSYESYNNCCARYNALMLLRVNNVWRITYAPPLTACSFDEVFCFRWMKDEVQVMGGWLPKNTSEEASLESLESTVVTEIRQPRTLLLPHTGPDVPALFPPTPLCS